MSVIFGFGFIFVLLSLATPEYRNVAYKARRVSIDTLPALLFIWLCLLAAQLEQPLLRFTGSVILLAGTLFGAVRSFERNQPGVLETWALTVAGAYYIGFLGSLFIEMRSLPNGDIWPLTTLLATCIADIGAGLVGRLVGRTQMTRLTSPRKT